MAGLSILVRCSDDPRVFRCLDSIDEPCDVVVSLTPNQSIEAEVARRGLRFARSPRGNASATTLAALSLCAHSRVLLVDSDCVFHPGAIRRMMTMAEHADIVRPTIRFDHGDLSSRATAIAREFQYTYCGFVYEPGLLVDLSAVLPAVGGYLFSPVAPFTPDGELDFRVRKSTLRIATDCEVTLTHASLSFRGHLWSYWRYGMSEASRMHRLKQDVLGDFLRGLPLRYRCALSTRYRRGTTLVIAVGDAVYMASMLYHLLCPADFPT